MSDLISREELEQNIKKRFCSTCDNYAGIKCRACLIEDCLDEVESALAIDVAPVVHGHWICTMLDDSTEEHGKAIRDYCDHGGDALKWMPDYAYCSKCLKGYCVMDNCMFETEPDYCPNCGAKMDEKGETEE